VWQLADGSFCKCLVIVAPQPRNGLTPAKLTLQTDQWDKFLSFLVQTLEEIEDKLTILAAPASPLDAASSPRSEFGAIIKHTKHSLV